MILTMKNLNRKKSYGEDAKAIISLISFKEAQLITRILGFRLRLRQSLTDHSIQGLSQFKDHH